MHKDYNMTQLTLPIETSMLIPSNDLSRNVNDRKQYLRMNINTIVLIIYKYDITNPSL